MLLRNFDDNMRTNNHGLIHSLCPNFLADVRKEGACKKFNLHAPGIQRERRRCNGLLVNLQISKIFMVHFDSW